MARLIRIFALTLGALLLGMTGIAAFAGGANTLTVSATVLSKNQCKFDSATSALNFGAINPSSVVNATATTTTTFACRGSSPSATFLITQNGGLYSTGPGLSRMRHATLATEYLPYTLNLAPFSATVPRNTTQTLTISGTVQVSDFQNAHVGAFQDTVILTITP